MKWTKEEVIAAEDYYTGCDHELAEDRWIHISEMMPDADCPERTPNAYRQKLTKVWNDRHRENHLDGGILNY